MDLTDVNTVKSILGECGFTFKKSLGQNFLTDSSVCPAMAESSADKTAGVIEIGPGAGVLTRELAAKAKRVVAIEIDSRLKPVLNKTVGGLDNVEVIFADVLKTDLDRLISERFSDCSYVSVCANLPYYITSPIITGLLSKRLNIKSITAMVQLEAAVRLCAPLGTRDAGAVSAAVEYYSSPSLLFKVGRECFVPSPKVDSAVIRLDIRKEPAVKVEDEKFFFLLIKSAFSQRRKTFLNSVSNTLNIEKSALKNALCAVGLSEQVRGEEITLSQFARISDMLCKNPKEEQL